MSLKRTFELLRGIQEIEKSLHDSLTPNSDKYRFCFHPHRDGFSVRHINSVMNVWVDIDTKISSNHFEFRKGKNIFTEDEQQEILQILYNFACSITK